MASSPRTPLSGGDNGDLVDDLIQQYAHPTDQNSKAPVSNKNGPSNGKPIDQAKHSKTSALGSPILVTKLDAQNGTSVGKSFDQKRPSNDSMSEVSEGEIVEDAATVPEKRSPIEPQNLQVAGKKAPLVRRGPRDEEPKRSSQRPPQDEVSSATRPTSTSSRPQNTLTRDETRDDDKRESRRRYSPDFKDRRSSVPDNRVDSYSYNSRRGARDQNEPDRRTEVKKDPKREEIRTSSLQNKPQEIRSPVVRVTNPTLDQVLPHDPDLREWLDITGYHNREYRDKILDRRRKIAALDAQKAQLLLEMEIEERGGRPASGGTPTLTTAMAPPPAPAKPPTPISKRADVNHSESGSDTDRNRVNSNKRAYSPPEQDEAGNSKKIARHDSRPRIKDDEDEPRNLRSFGYDSYRNDHRDDRDYDGMYFSFDWGFDAGSTKICDELEKTDKY